MTVDLRVDGNATVSSNTVTTHSQSSWKPLGAYFIGTQTNNTETREQILTIAKELGLEVEVEVLSSARRCHSRTKCLTPYDNLGKQRM